MNDLPPVTQIKSALGDVITTRTVIGSCGVLEEQIEISCPHSFIDRLRPRKKASDHDWIWQENK